MLTYLLTITAKTTSLVEDEPLKWLRQVVGTADKSVSPLWSPITYREGGRKAALADKVYALVFDFDNGRPPFHAGDTGLLFAWHTTHSHTRSKPKWRLVLPLSEPVPAQEWKGFYDRAAEMLQLHNYDLSCADLAQFFYVPPPDAQWEVSGGQLLLPTQVVKEFHAVDLKSLRALLLKASNPDYADLIRKALQSEPVAGTGARDNAVTGLGYYLGRSVVPSHVNAASVLTLLRGGFDLGEPGRKHWETKFEAAFSRGRAAREANIQAQGLTQEWQKQLQTVAKLDGTKTVLSNTYNAAIILRNDPAWAFRRNTLEDCQEFFKDNDWHRMSDADTTNVANWLQEKYRVNLSRQQVYDQIDACAAPFDPLDTYLESQEWGGVQRLDTFLTHYLGCEDTPITRMYSRKWLIGLVTRAKRPGCKMDTVLVLQGKQGYGKSTALKILAYPWFSDSKVTIGDKDSLLAASRFWLHEFAELASLKRTDLETMKAFFTSTEDAYRPPYGRATILKPRRCVYVATTNEDEFLNDMTGARRFWVCRVVKPIDFEALKRDRAQILAEAVAAFKRGESYWLDSDEERSLQEADSEEYRMEEYTAIQDEIIKWWSLRPIEKRPEHMTVSLVVRDVMGVPLDRISKGHELAAARALRELGFLHVRANDKGRRRWAWIPPFNLLKMEQRKGEVVT